MKKTLRNIVGTGLILGVTTLGSGCANVFYRHPVDKYIWNKAYEVSPIIVPPSIKEEIRKEKTRELREMYLREEAEKARSIKPNKYKKKPDSKTIYF